MRSIALIALVVAAIGCTRERLNVIAGGACGAPDGGVTVRPADDFLDMLGMAVSMGDLPQNDAAGRPIVDHLRELRITRVHTADSWPETRAPAAATLRAAALRPLFSLSREVDIDAFLATWGDLASAIALPGLDEPNSTGTLRGQVAVDNARRLVAVARAQPPGRRPSVVGMRVSNEADARELGDLSDLCDFGAFRAGIGQHPPRDSFGGWLDLAQSIAPRRPLVATSFSYLGRSPSAAPLANETETVQAKYVTRMLLGLFNRGIVHAYQNRLQDSTCPDCKDGLLREDGSEKPAYAAWRALVRVLTAAAGSAPPPATLSFSIEQPASLDDLQRTVLGRADGAVVVLLWREVRSTDEPATATVTLRFSEPPRAVLVHDLLSDSAQQASTAGDAVTVTVSDMPSAIVLVPGCTP